MRRGVLRAFFAVETFVLYTIPGASAASTDFTTTSRRRRGSTPGQGDSLPAAPGAIRVGMGEDVVLEVPPSFRGIGMEDEVGLRGGGVVASSVRYARLAGEEGEQEGQQDGGANNRPPAHLLNLWHSSNRAVALSCFSVGFANNFLTAPLTYYLAHSLDASPAQQNVVWTLTWIPWSLKPVYGFVTDNFPVCGMRRKPYLAGGWAVYVGCNLLLASLEIPGVRWIAALQLLGITGFMQAEVTSDAIMVERSKLEPEATRGSMQAVGYTLRFAGAVVGSVLGSIVYNRERWGWGLSISAIFALNGLLPAFLLLPWVGSLSDPPAAPAQLNQARASAIKSQLGDVFHTMSLQAVYVPMAIIFIYK
jgi:hypothetical protein